MANNVSTEVCRIMKIVSQCHDRPCGARARDDCHIAQCAIHSEQYGVDELRAAAQLVDYEAQKAQKAISVSRAQFTVKMMAEEDELRVLKNRRNDLYRAANLKEAACEESDTSHIYDLVNENTSFILEPSKTYHYHKETDDNESKIEPILYRQKNDDSIIESITHFPATRSRMPTVNRREPFAGSSGGRGSSRGRGGRGRRIDNL